jgi:DNA-binding MarR family transcriptional regulator
MHRREEECPFDFERLSLQDLLLTWNEVGWWTGFRPILRRMLEAKLSLPDCIMLRTLQRGRLTIAEAADCLNVHVLSTASRTVDRLVRDGYISRQEDPDDRRQKQLTLTPKGLELIEDFQQTLARNTRPMLEVLDDEEREQFRRLMVKMLAGWRDRQAASPEGYTTPQPDEMGSEQAPAAGMYGTGSERDTATPLAH